MVTITILLKQSEAQFNKEILESSVCIAIISRLYFDNVQQKSYSATPSQTFIRIIKSF